MAVANTCRMDIRGSILNSTEIFSVSLWLSTNVDGALVPGTNAQAQSALTTLMGDPTFGAMLDGWRALIFPADAYTSVTLYCYPTGGTSAAAVATAPITGKAGTSTASGAPLQTSMVLTLRTGQAGRSFRGRIYLPARGGMASGATGYLASGTGPVVTPVINWLHQIAILTPFPGGVGARAGVASTRRGVFTPLSQITVDLKPDIQRRRANKFPSGTVFSYPL